MIDTGRENSMSKLHLPDFNGKTQEGERVNFSFRRWRLCGRGTLISGDARASAGLWGLGIFDIKVIILGIASCTSGIFLSSDDRRLAAAATLFLFGHRDGALQVREDSTGVGGGYT